MVDMINKHVLPSAKAAELPQVAALEAALDTLGKAIDPQGHTAHHTPAAPSQFAGKRLCIATALRRGPARTDHGNARGAQGT